MKTLITTMRSLFLGLALAVVSHAASATTTDIYYHNDLAGTPLAATDAGGNPLWRQGYKPYGERLDPKAPAEQQPWFTGKAHVEAAGLSYYGARWYDPQLGRFMGVDPKGFGEENVHSFNRYAYANNNPYRFVDPDGRQAAALFPIVAGALIVGGGFRAATPEQQRAIVDGLNKIGEYSMIGRLGALLGQSLLSESANSPSDSNGDGQKDVTKRPSRVRKGTEQANWDNAESGESGGKLCPTCGKEVQSRPGERNKEWDNDHTPPWRDRDLTGKDRKGVLDDYNGGTRLRCVNCNRSDNGS